MHSYSMRQEALPTWLAMVDLPRRLQVSRATIFNMIKAGRFPAGVSMTGGRAKRWHISTVEAWERQATGAEA